MEISGPLHLLPQSRPPPTFETFGRRNAERIPRAFPVTFPAASSARARHRIQRLSRPQVHVAQVRPQRTLDINPWKLTREFDDLVEAYKQSEPQANEQHVEVRLNEQSSTQERRSSQTPRDSDTMTSQRETVSIGYDPNYGLQKDSGLAHRDIPDSARDMSSHYESDNRATIQAELEPKAAVQATVYHVDWLTTEVHDITDKDFYDRDADADASAGSETDNSSYSYAPDRSQTAAYPPAPVRGSTPPTSTEFERARQVPYDHRKTRAVVKEDIDFFLAVLGGLDPPSATRVETQSILSEEQEVRRKSQEALAQESSLRKQAEMEDTQSDLDFWMSLMQEA